ncbi:hypothetical protein DFA_02834 [Cavenderia fasciculata]|uniref:Uncharacterized protein n=1 Tax=Cavenderia fasciculata TaxID=261658 RepID=F4PIL1_CACFS|nr:uncharacterized protein DFA_02834 [Cavenderia fasciculata]EGG24591.1 hypothetical protein DFA_02834 [Cavenderia fasciculata]|eukprot:XP_004362442.1 hypothetical protein DFA_02834 [Cavenderia fasciculata]
MTQPETSIVPNPNEKTIVIANNIPLTITAYVSTDEYVLNIDTITGLITNNTNAKNKQSSIIQPVQTSTLHINSKFAYIQVFAHDNHSGGMIHLFDRQLEFGHTLKILNKHLAAKRDVPHYIYDGLFQKIRMVDPSQTNVHNVFYPPQPITPKYYQDQSVDAYQLPPQ